MMFKDAREKYGFSRVGTLSLNRLLKKAENIEIIWAWDCGCGSFGQGLGGGSAGEIMSRM